MCLMSHKFRVLWASFFLSASKHVCYFCILVNFFLCVCECRRTCVWESGSSWAAGGKPQGFYRVFVCLHLPLAAHSQTTRRSLVKITGHVRPAFPTSWRRWVQQLQAPLWHCPSVRPISMPTYTSVFCTFFNHYLSTPHDVTKGADTPHRWN